MIFPRSGLTEGRRAGLVRPLPFGSPRSVSVRPDSVLRFLRLLTSFALPLGALGLHGFIVLCYARRWDKAAAVTVYPFWAWGLLGLGMALTAWLFTRRRFPLAVAALWLGTVVFYADETRPLLRSSARRPQPGPAAPFEGKPVLRVLSFNCRVGPFDPKVLEEVVPWEPDIVLFQESAGVATLRKLAQRLYGVQDPARHVAGGWECGIVTRGKVVRQLPGSGIHRALATIEFPGGVLVDVASVHLRGAETDMRLYRRETFVKHAANRIGRRDDLRRLLRVRALLSGQRPVIIGGDFNAPAGDAIFRLLEDAGFTDAFAAAGAGWPNTFPNQAPVLRIDHQWVNARLVPVRGGTAKSERSDHRMVVCDYLAR